MTHHIFLGDTRMIEDLMRSFHASTFARAGVFRVPVRLVSRPKQVASPMAIEAEVKTPRHWLERFIWAARVLGAGHSCASTIYYPRSDDVAERVQEVQSLLDHAERMGAIECHLILPEAGWARRADLPEAELARNAALASLASPILQRQTVQPQSLDSAVARIATELGLDEAETLPRLTNRRLEKARRYMQVEHVVTDPAAASATDKQQVFGALAEILAR